MNLTGKGGRFHSLAYFSLTQTSLGKQEEEEARASKGIRFGCESKDR